MLAGLAIAANAVTFTGVSISGTGSTNATFTQVGNSLLLSLPSLVAFNGSANTVTVNYTVTANPGFVLPSITVDPVGSIVGTGTANVNVTHTPTGPDGGASWMSPGGLSSFTATNSVFSSAYAGVATVNLTSGVGGISKLTQLTVTYQPVPEPATLGALAVGLAGILARRKRGAK